MPAAQTGTASVGSFRLNYLQHFRTVVPFNTAGIDTKAYKPPFAYSYKLLYTVAVFYHGTYGTST